MRTACSGQVRQPGEVDGTPSRKLLLPCPYRSGGQIGSRPVQKGPCWSLHGRQSASILLLHPKARQSLCSNGRSRGQGGTRPVYDRNRHQLCNLFPALPTMELRQIVSPHKPDKSGGWKALCQHPQRIIGKAGLNASFKTCNRDGRMIRQLLGISSTRIQWRQSVIGFQRIARRHHPPNFLQAQPLQGHQRNMAMAIMSWIKSTAQNANTLQGLSWRDFGPVAQISTGLTDAPGRCHARGN